MSRKYVDGPHMSQVIRKVVVRFVPMLLMYVLAYLDRANIGFAQIGMEADLGLSTSAFALGAGLFFIGYAASEIPSNLILGKVGARIWLSRIMVTFGIIAIGTALVHNEWSFVACRVLLGIAEGGLFPGIVLFLTYWIPGNYWNRVMGTFLFGAPLALIFGSPVSGALLSLDGLLGFHGWQIMFFTTGFATIAVGIWAFFYMDNVPANARFLTDQERDLLLAEMNKTEREREKLSPKGLVRAFTDWRLLCFILVYFTIQVGMYGIVFFLPLQVVSITGHKAGFFNGLLTAIPWAFSVLALVALTRMADRRKRNAVLAFICLFVGGIGIVGGAMTRTPVIMIGAFSLATSGVMAVQPLFWKWPTSMLTGSAATGGLAFINALGNFGGFVAPTLKTWMDSKTGNGYAGLLALGGLTAAGSLLLLFADAIQRSAPIAGPDAGGALSLPRLEQ